MKFVYSFVLVLLAIISVSEAMSHSLMKRKTAKCSSHKCPLELKPCPKDCPQSCGYIDSPDPCCPLLGKPSCPDY